MVVPPRWAAYVEASRAVFKVFERHLAAGRGAVDRRGVPRRARAGAQRRARPTEIALRLRSRRARAASGLPITVGVATTKFLAKVASAVAKPDGLLIVPPGGELAFLHPLPVERLWGVGPGDRRPLHATASLTVGQVAALDEAELVAIARAGRRPPPALPGPQPRPPPGARAGGAGARSARSRPSGAARARPRRSTRCWSGWSTG